MRFIAALILSAIALTCVQAEDDEIFIGVRTTKAVPIPGPAPAPAAQPATPTAAAPAKKVEPYTGPNFGLAREEPRDRRTELFGFGTVDIENAQAVTRGGTV